MANNEYQGKVYRVAVASKVGKNFDSWELIDDSYDWRIYKESGNEEKYHLIKVVKDPDSNGNYNFNFKFNSFTDTSKECFALLFKRIEQRIKSGIKSATFYLAMGFGKQNWNFHVAKLLINSNDTSEPKFKNIEKEPDYPDTIYKIKINLDKKTVKYSPYPKTYDLEKLESEKLENVIYIEKTISLNNDTLNKIKKDLKIDNYPDTDWQRLKDRSFDKMLKYCSNELYDICNQYGKCEKESFTPENLRWCKKYYEAYFENEVISKQAFKEKFFKEGEERKCAYCGIPEELLFLFETKRAGRGERLEYDRLDSKKGYCEDNVVLACYWCNNAKTDTFSPGEFKKIAQAINELWNKKLTDAKEQGIEGIIKEYKKIEFPKEYPTSTRDKKSTCSVCP